MWLENWVYSPLAPKQQAIKVRHLTQGSLLSFRPLEMQNSKASTLLGKARLDVNLTGHVPWKQKIHRWKHKYVSFIEPWFWRSKNRHLEKLQVINKQKYDEQPKTSCNHPQRSSSNVKKSKITTVCSYKPRQPYDLMISFINSYPASLKGKCCWETQGL